jgi:hypothetical protein
LQSVRLAEDEECEAARVYPGVIADGLDSFEDECGRAASQRKLPEALRAVALDADDGEEASIGRERRRILALGCLCEAHAAAVAQFVPVDVCLPVGSD